jgi:NhaA family Na+:H+ antiporter
MAAEYAQRREKLAGLLLIAAAALALVAANSRLAGAYAALLHWKIGPSLPRMGMLSVEQWIADGLMAGFFLLVGLEVKREWFEGQLATQAQRRLPMIAAAAGMIVPAFVYLLVTGFDPSLSDGWAIPAATDIAFAIGVLALLGTRANPSIKVLLITIAIADDIGAVIIIALFYASDLNLTAIGAALVILAAMIALARLGVRQLWPFMIGFALLWITMLASGIHPTVAGVLTALTIPLGPAGGHSPLKQLEHRLHPWVMFGVMGLFGFASAGVEINGAGELLQPVPLGVLVGLFVGKQLGVFGALWLAVKSGLCAAPANVRWIELYGAALLCGIGFTMSLFIGALAFPAAPETVEAAKIGTLAGSLLSALCGWAILRFARRPVSHREDAIAAEQVFAADQPD